MTTTASPRNMAAVFLKGREILAKSPSSYFPSSKSVSHDRQMSCNYDVAFRFVNDTEWTATLEAWGPDPRGRDNGVMLILRPQERVTFMQNANVSYYFCVRHHGIEAGFSTKILVDTPTNISEIVPHTLPANYATITPLSPRVGVTVRRYKRLTHYINGW